MNVENNTVVAVLEEYCVPTRKINQVTGILNSGRAVHSPCVGIESIFEGDFGYEIKVEKGFGTDMRIVSDLK